MIKTCHICNGTGELRIPVGERMKAIREKNGYTQDQLAKVLGITRSSMSNIESGKQDVSADKLYAFAKQFYCTTDYLLGLEG